jgi:hypothetical protein
MRSSITLLLVCLLISCTNKKALTEEERIAYEKELNSWHAKRIEEVKAPNGWLNLVGLYWLEPGINSFGSDEKNLLVFPKDKIAAEAGYFLVKNNVVTLTVKPGVTITTHGKPITSQIVFHPDSAKVIEMQSGSLRWTIIKRDSKLGIRLRDDDSPILKSFAGVERFTVNPDFRVNAHFEKSDSSRTIDITNIIGQTIARRSPGTLSFNLNGSKYHLDVLEGNKEEYFIVFGDATSGKETYGGGRFLYVKKPNAEGNTIVDFNKSYNPPCVFTPFATCPVPPSQNILTLEIKAGEKNYGGLHTTDSPH